MLCRNVEEETNFFTKMWRISWSNSWSKNKYTYFFHDGEYYRFDDKRFQIDKGDPAFPRPSGVWWFGCKSANLKGGSSVTDYEDDDYNDDDYDDDGKTFFTRFLQKKDEVVNFFHNFDEADDTMLDVFSGDEWINDV